MLHLIWYIIVGLIAGWAAKSLMHMHMSLMWTLLVLWLWHKYKLHIPAG